MRVTLEAIGSFDQAIAERAQNHPDFALFEALPGAGAALAPCLLVAFGEQRERYGSAAEVQTYAGIAPVMERSGKQSWVHWRCQCPKFMRQTFAEWAAESMQFSALITALATLPPFRLSQCSSRRTERRWRYLDSLGICIFCV